MFEHISQLSVLAAQVREYLEKHYAETSGKETIKLALKSLMETVEAGSKNVEVTLWPLTCCWCHRSLMECCTDDWRCCSCLLPPAFPCRALGGQHAHSSTSSHEGHGLSFEQCCVVAAVRVCRPLAGQAA